MKILLVEDHEFLAQITRSQLREIHDHEVAHAFTAAAALELASQAKFDLVLLDLNLPDLNGYSLAAKLRELDGFDDTVIVTLTGIGNHTDPAKAAQSGVDAQFTKPMDFSDLPNIKRKTK